MAKKREKIPRLTSDKVSKEYNHRCAICGEDNPQFHHIDENPANNGPLNLIPLCPNCHTRQHNPLYAIEFDMLKLYRIHKHPYILKAQFHPLFSRMQFLNTIAQKDVEELSQKAEELIELVEAHEMGTFYAKRLQELIRKPKYARVWVMGDPDSERRNRELNIKATKEYKEKLQMVRNQVVELIIEMLWYQPWESSSERRE